MTHANVKAQAYAALVSARKECRLCAGLANPSACQEGIYDYDHIGPWSLWQGNLNATLMIVGQDWGDVTFFRKHEGHDPVNNRTNETLRHLLATIGAEIAGPSPTDRGGGPLFFTNAILCLKSGGMQAKVDPAWFTSCGQRFLRPTIEIVRAKVVVTLGERAYVSLLAAYSLKPQPFRMAVEQQDAIELPGGINVFAVYHCGARIVNTHRPMAKQIADWARIGRTLKQPERQV